MKQTKILLSHPNFDNSMMNKYLANVLNKNEKFSVRCLDKIRTNGYFDLEDEKKFLEDADMLVWQFPLYWYSCPSSLRDWQDQVMSPIVYSANNFLKGKSVQVIFTAGAGEENYSHEGLNRYTIDEMLRPLEMTVNAAGMVWKKPIGFFGCSEERKEEVFKEMDKVAEQICAE